MSSELIRQFDIKKSRIPKPMMSKIPRPVAMAVTKTSTSAISLLKPLNSTGSRHVLSEITRPMMPKVSKTAISKITKSSTSTVTRSAASTVARPAASTITRPALSKIRQPVLTAVTRPAMTTATRPVMTKVAKSGTSIPKNVISRKSIHQPSHSNLTAAKSYSRNILPATKPKLFNVKQNASGTIAKSNVLKSTKTIPKDFIASKVKQNSTNVKRADDKKKNEDKENVPVVPRHLREQQGIEFEPSEFCRNLILNNRELSPSIMKLGQGFKLSTLQCDRPSAYEKFESVSDPYLEAMKSINNPEFKSENLRYSRNILYGAQETPIIERSSIYFPIERVEDPFAEAMKSIKSMRAKKSAKKKVTFSISETDSNLKTPSDVKQNEKIISTGLSSAKETRLTSISEKTEEKTPTDCKSETLCSELNQLPEIKIKSPVKNDKVPDPSSQPVAVFNFDFPDQVSKKSEIETKVKHLEQQLSTVKQLVSEHISENFSKEIESRTVSAPNMNNDRKLKATNETKSINCNYKNNFQTPMAPSCNNCFVLSERINKLRLLNSVTDSAKTKAKLIQSADIIIKDNSSKCKITPTINNRNCSQFSSVLKSETKGKSHNGREHNIFTPQPISLNSNYRCMKNVTPDFFEEKASKFITMDCAPIITPLLMRNMAKRTSELDTPSSVRMKLNFQENDDVKQSTQQLKKHNNQRTAFATNIYTRQKLMDDLANKEVCFILNHHPQISLISRIQNPLAVTLSTGDETHFQPIE